ncbi:MAG: hypothetical protein ORN51_05670 [Akkermansiaceae bacterium]|nr:hypothetical protein [Akkermansiaceae bacterium]
MNKHARFLIAALAILALISGAVFWMNQRPLRPVAATSFLPPDPSGKPEPKTNAASPLPPVRCAPAPESTSLVQADSILAVTRIAQSPPIAESQSKVKLQGNGETAVLSDSDGKLLLQATPNNPIYSMKPSPSGRQAIVSRGNGINELYNLQPFGLIRQLPLVPDIPRASAFGPWDWIDESTLIAVVDVARPPSELTHLTGAERESAANWREQTLLYSFKLADGKLARINTAKAGLPPSFTVIEMHSGGLVKVEWDEKGVAQTFWVATSGK